MNPTPRPTLSSQTHCKVDIAPFHTVCAVLGRIIRFIETCKLCTRCHCLLSTRPPSPLFPAPQQYTTTTTHITKTRHDAGAHFHQQPTPPNTNTQTCIMLVHFDRAKVLGFAVKAHGSCTIRIRPGSTRAWPLCRGERKKCPRWSHHRLGLSRAHTC